jgi:hypothetical protein
MVSQNKGRMADQSMDSMFQKKFTEFCDELDFTFPEKGGAILRAKELSPAERMRRFREEVMPTAGNPNRDSKLTPGPILPGVSIEERYWETFSGATKKAINQYLTLLSFCCMFGDKENPWADMMSGSDEKMKGFMGQMMKDWQEKMSKVDFKSLSEKIMNVFGTMNFAGAAGAAGGAAGAGARPGFTLPEGMLKGQLAKLAEELVREFKPEDFGLDAAALESSDDPSRAFTLLMEVYTQKPELIQNAMKKITKRLQQKVQSGELKPADLAAEAEEMMKNFTDNPAFMELMEGFRNAFGFEDTDTARSAGRDGENRLSIARKRLRAKLEARKGNAKK